MEVGKRLKTRSKSLIKANSGKNDVAPELNGENVALADAEEHNTDVTVEEKETEMEADSSEPSKDDDSNTKDENEQSEENMESENVSDSAESKVEVKTKGRKRKASESKNDQAAVSEEKDIRSNAEEFEPESQYDMDSGDMSLDNSDLSLPPKQTFGKGKRARIPNKRYSDIHISPQNKLLKKLENGKESEKIESEELPISGEKPPVVTLPKVSSNSPALKKPKLTVDLTNPNYLKPFEFGWKRELVWRANNDPGSNKRNGDIYYYTPTGKKVRSMREVSEHLKDKSLSLDDFTFFKEPLGINDDSKEIIRDAKYKIGGVITPQKKSAIFKPKSLSSPKSQSPKVQSPKLPIRSPPKLLKAGESPDIENVNEGLEDVPFDDSLPELAPAPTLKLEPKSAKKAETKSKVNFRVKLPTKNKNEKKFTKILDDEEDISESLLKQKAAKKTSPKQVVHKTASNETVKAKKKMKLNNSVNSIGEKAGMTNLMEGFLQNVSFGYNTLLYVFQYLKVQDLLRAGCVCTMWRDIASHPILWRTVRMKNSQVHSFEGLANTLQKHGTVHLDLRKMLLTQKDTDKDFWTEFSQNIGKVDTLRKIELCRCPPWVVESIMKTNPKLEVLNAVTIRSEEMNIDGLSELNCLKELRLKTTFGLKFTSNLDSLKKHTKLKHLSLTSVRGLNEMNLEVIGQLVKLESLDLGECTDFPKNFGSDILEKLVKLEKLRLEKGQGNCNTFEILAAVKNMSKLEQLELVNFDIKAGFDKALGACVNIKKLLIIPTYISQSATTNHMVLGGVLRLQKSLSHFVWGVTLELLRVTELFVDQCEEPEKKEKEKKPAASGDSIPVLKPVPVLTDGVEEIPAAFDPPQVEILPLQNLQKLLLQSLPTTRVKILKIPFHATWRQSITDSVN